MGSAFAFRKKTHFLTTAQCIRSLKASEILLSSPSINSGAAIEIQSVTPHPTADVAVLRIAASSTFRLAPFCVLGHSPVQGSDLGVFGYSEDSSPASDRAPVARFLRGKAQRLFAFQSEVGYAYAAVELSIPVPVGLRGGPVFAMPPGIHVLGLLTEDDQGISYPRSAEEVQQNGHLYEGRVDAPGTFAVCALLLPLELWLLQEVGLEF